MNYDVIFAGGGAAALLLLYKLTETEWIKDKQILVIDKEKKNTNNRTWSFWTNKETDFDKMVYREWKNVRFTAPNIDKIETLDTLTYKMLRGIDFYKVVNQKLTLFNNIHFVEDEIKEIRASSAQKVIVKTSLQAFEGALVFDSLFSEKDIPPKSASYHSLLQHFQGYVIKSEQAIFMPDTVQLFDMRLPQRNAVEFVYILPFSEKEALVEYTLFSSGLLPNKELYKVRLENYITTKLGLSEYEILEEEYGVIPMTDYKFNSSSHQNIIFLGTKAGKAKPSTGYAFLRMYRDACERAKALAQTGSPHYEEKFSKQFETYDSMILNIMERNPADIQRIFTHMFKNNPIERILLFLDEQTDFVTDLKIMASVPPAPFLVSVKNLLTGKKGTKLRAL